MCALTSPYDRPKANKVFTNRDKPIIHFNRLRANLAPDRHYVLSFYGVGGQGKTALCKEFERILAAEDPRQSPRPPEYALLADARKAYSCLPL